MLLALNDIEQLLMFWLTHLPCGLGEVIDALSPSIPFAKVPFYSEFGSPFLGV